MWHKYGTVDGYTLQDVQADGWASFATPYPLIADGQRLDRTLDCRFARPCPRKADGHILDWTVDNASRAMGRLA